MKGGIAAVEIGFGAADAGWLPVAGDWDGDGIDAVGLYDPATAVWYLRNSHTGGNADLTFNFGPPDAGWCPIAGDWNADGTDTIGLYNAGWSNFYLRDSNSGGIAELVTGFGAPDAGWRPARGSSDCLTQIVDNGADAHYGTQGEWSTLAALGFRRGDADRSNGGDGSDLAHWDFHVLPGRYTVAAAWAAQDDLAFNARFTVYDGSASPTTVGVNQRQDPQDFTDQQTGWKPLGTFQVTGNQLIVTLTDNASGP